MGSWKTDEELVTIYTPVYETKSCPRCGALMFADMDLCYSCLGDDKRQKEQSTTGLGLQVKTDEVELLLPLPCEGLVIGRGPSCDVVLHARAVSRQHVRVEPCGQEATVTDLGATNLAMVRDEELRGAQTLGIGDELRICHASFILQEIGANKVTQASPEEDSA
ncbi:MAG: FHA domain-containing protein [Coriobacteriales bacterium]|nr:FHA domain-containing protein [Coriobacteriales bacterium]